MIVIAPEAVPLLVFNTKSVVPPVVTVKVPAPLEVRVAAAAASPTFTVSAAKTTSPVPAGTMLMSILESLLPVEERVGPAPLAPAAIVNSFSAEPVTVIFINSFPPVSKIFVPIFGEVKVLLL